MFYFLQLSMIEHFLQSYYFSHISWKYRSYMRNEKLKFDLKIK